MAKVGRNDPCPCGSGTKYKRCCGAAALVEAPPPPEPPEDSFEIQLVVETPRGAMVRRVRAATPLRTDIEHGSAAELATHDAAAVWGLPDFVFRAKLAHTASGVREMGDGFVLAGGLGLSIQVKSREGELGNPARETRWIVKKAAEAIRQADGTVRRLSLQPTRLTNLRGYEIDVDPAEYKWLNVVVIDHPSAPDGVRPEVDRAQRPTVVLLRRDWEFLFDQLKSTTAVAGYIDRVAGEPWDLGLETARYYDHAQADAGAPPDEFKPALAAGGEVVPAPLLPLAPAGTDDIDALRILRTLMEDIAVTKLTRSTESDRLRLLAALDRLPVAQRELVGRRVLAHMSHVESDAEEPGLVWRMSSVRAADGRIHLGYGTCSRPYTDSEVPAGLELWTRLRHFDVLEAAADPALVEDLTTVAVLVTPRSDGERPWDTSVAAVSGPIQFDAAQLRLLREHFPGPGASGSVLAH